MSWIHLGSGFAVAAAVPMVLLEFAPGAILIALISGLVVTVVAALPPLIFAQAAQGRTARLARSVWSDLVAVVLGALIGSVIPLLAFGVFLQMPWWVPAGIGVASAAGFAIQVALAWRHRDPPNRDIR